MIINYFSHFDCKGPAIDDVTFLRKRQVSLVSTTAGRAKAGSPRNVCYFELQWLQLNLKKRKKGNRVQKDVPASIVVSHPKLILN